MRPEVASAKLPVPSAKSEYLELGVPEDWVDALKALGYDTIDKLKAVEKPGKLHQEMMGYRKKNKLEIATISVEEVNSWIQ